MLITTNDIARNTEIVLNKSMKIKHDTNVYKTITDDRLLIFASFSTFFVLIQSKHLTFVQNTGTNYVVFLSLT